MAGTIQLLDRRAASVASAAPTPPVREPGSKPIQPIGPNRTGLPDRLKAGVEALSGLAMDDVRVHRNSSEPAKIGALAYARGSDIHLGPGQQKHLPHEMWHVVQQKQGRVRTTALLKGREPVNDDRTLEREADLMGALAAGLKARVEPREGGAAAAGQVCGTGASAASRPTLQLTARTDANDADVNRAHLAAETFPGLSIDLNNVIGHLQNQLDDYELANALAPDPPAADALSQSAQGLLIMTQNIIEQADAKWTEAGVMDQLQNTNVDNVPVPARNNALDPDIEFTDQDNFGAVTGYEIKTVNSANVASVTTQIQNADGQLGARALARANLAGAAALLRPALTQRRIHVWIAHADNRWPGAAGFAARIDDATVEADVEAQLGGMALGNADQIELVMIRTPAGHPAMNDAVDVTAVSAGGGAWNANVTHHH